MLQEVFCENSFIRIYFLILSAVFGAAMGSFLYCTAWRIVHGKSVLRGRSKCDACGRELTVRDLIPIVSYFAAKGRCRTCGTKLSAIYPVSEIAGAILFALTVGKFGISLQTIEWLIFISLLMAISFADLEEYIIPDRFIVIGLLVRLGYLVFWEREAALSSVIGAVAVPGALVLIVFISEKFLKREAMGGGDIKLLIMTGFYLGWKHNILCLFLACVIGIAFGFFAKRRSEREDGAFPWGPSIAMAAFIVMMCGDAVINAYLGLF